MVKDRIAFVTIRYGKDINGGAEYHCRMLAERLADDYDIHVLTTCVRDYNTGENEYSEGTEEYNGVLVRRFKVAPIDSEKHKLYLKKEKPASKLRRLLYRLGVLKYIANIHSIWTYKQEVEIKTFRSYPFYSPDMAQYIIKNKDTYKVFIPINMAEPTTYFTALAAPEKTLLIPTMHDQKAFFRSIQTQVMTNVAYIGFNTSAEQKLAQNVFGKHLSRNGIIGVGIEEFVPASWEEIKLNYNLPEQYILYVGRVTPNKMGELFQYFVAYKKKYSETNLKLVLVGGVTSGQIPFSHPDVNYTGFVDDTAKIAILQHARIVVNPSRYESLSLILLEAMSFGKAMLVNGKCDVLKEHCIRSNYAALYYMNENDFVASLHKLEISDALRKEMGEKAIEYVKVNYDWSVILARLKSVIKTI